MRQPSFVSRCHQVARSCKNSSNNGGFIFLLSRNVLGSRDGDCHPRVRNSAFVEDLRSSPLVFTVAGVLSMVCPVRLQNAGKSSFIRVINTGKFEDDMIPTIGFQMHKVCGKSLFAPSQFSCLSKRSVVVYFLFAGTKRKSHYQGVGFGRTKEISWYVGAILPWRGSHRVCRRCR